MGEPEKLIPKHGGTAGSRAFRLRNCFLMSRCTTADDVAVWAKDVHDGCCGQGGQRVEIGM